MLYGLYISAAGMLAQQYRNDVTANNLANSQTTGFKRDLALIQSRQNATFEDSSMAQYRTPVLGRQGGGVLNGPTCTDLSQGSLQQTSSTTDVALEGPGFFKLEGDAHLPTLLTRDGKFTLRADGQLVSATSGKAVLDSSNQPIKLNPALLVQITPEGEVRQGGEVAAKLGIVDVKNPLDLLKVGGNTLTVSTPKAVQDAGKETQVRQGFLESSGVDPTVEMVNMMEGQRVFEANAKMVQYQDQTLSDLNTVGRIA